MKVNYPNYARGKLVALEKKLSINNKKIFYDFLEHCNTTAGERKMGKIKRVMLQIHDITEKDFDKLDNKAITSFLVVLNKSNRSGWTKNETKIYLKKFLRWHYKDLSLVSLVKTTARDKEVSVSENDLITEEEFEKMIEACDSLRKKALLSILWESGARPEEILNLKWKDIVFQDDVAMLSFHSNKTNKTRSFPVKRAREFLWFYKQQWLFPKVKGEDFVFVTPENRKTRISTTAVNKLLRKISKRAGIEKDVWMYLWRHSRATALYENLPQQIVEKLLGHKEMAKVYAHISNKKANEELISKIYRIEALPPKKKQELEKRIIQLELKLMLHDAEISKEEYNEELAKLT